MQKYELMVMVAPQATEAANKKVLAEVEKLLKSHKASDIKEDFWGEKELAYKIEKFDKAVYSVFNFEMNTADAKDISKNLNLVDNVFRYLLTKVEE